jgi:ribonuclease D
LITQPQQWSACLEHLSRVSVVGLDTEFVGEGRYQPHLCLIQIATWDALYVIDPFAITQLQALWELLQDPQRLVVVHGGKEDIRICQQHGGQPPARLFDTQIAAALIGMDYPIGYSRLVEALFRASPKKDLTMSDWRRRPLTQAQLRYAFDDVRYLLPAYQLLHDRLQQHQRQDWAEEEFAALVQRTLAEDDTSEGWRRFKGLHHLDRASLAVVRELYQWREEYSRQMNRPNWQVLADHTLVRIARLKPHSLRDLITLRGVPHHLAAEILDVVLRALALPPIAQPAPVRRIPDSTFLKTISQFLQIILHDWCTRAQVAATLTATSADLKAFAYHHLCHQSNNAELCHLSDSVDLPLVRGWRARAILPELQAALAGQRFLAIDLQNNHHSPLRVYASNTPPIPPATAHLSADPQSRQFPQP